MLRVPEFLSVRRRRRSITGFQYTRIYVCIIVRVCISARLKSLLERVLVFLVCSSMRELVHTAASCM